jgi:hypothetical protein
MTTVSPDSDTEIPNWSSVVPSAATIFCCSVQTVPERTNA